MAYRDVDGECDVGTGFPDQFSEEHCGLAEDTQIHLVDQTDLFGYGDKLARTDHIAFAVLHTCECFETAQFVSDIVLWLQIVENGILLQCVTDLALGRQILLDLCQVLCEVEDAVILDGILYFVHGGIGIGDKYDRRLGIRGILRISEACIQEIVTVVNGDLLLQGFLIAFDRILNIFFALIGTDHDKKFIPAGTRQKVLCFRIFPGGDSPPAFADLDQYFVPDRVSHGIVDALEIIQIG